MIVYDLACSNGHRFEGWFGSSDDFGAQKTDGLLSCPQCGCSDIGKAPMAPAVSAKGNRQVASAQETTQVATGKMHSEVKKAFEKLARAQTKALESSTWVGDKFTEQARAMHYGETKEIPIHGRATQDQAQDMVSEGIAVAPLLVPVAPPDELN